MLKRIPLSAIYGNPDQPRKRFDPVELAGLAASIRENGLKQPITVRADSAGRYMIVMGERRFRAHQLIAGATDILCNVVKVDDDQLAIDAIIENDQRVDVTPLEQARSYQRMIDMHGFTVEDLARKLGRPVFRIEERTNLLKLSPDNQQLLERGVITSGHAWYLVQLEPRKQDMLVRAIATGQCKTTGHLKAVFEAIRDDGAQAGFFADETPASEQDRKASQTFEDRMEAVGALLRACVVDNEVVAMRRVARHKVGTAADVVAAMQVDLRRIETALRVAAAGNAMMEA